MLQWGEWRVGEFKELLHSLLRWVGVVGTQHGTNSWPRTPTGDSSLHLPCHKTHFLLVLGITRCDAGTKDNTDSGDEEPVICFDASIQPTKMQQHLDTRGACNRQDTLIYKMSGLIFQS